ncbi:MAG: hypothetical protein A3E87_10575 [Gammaproteobacteria bacterium RIFCSPHIGHO2_12_FULL_35_23]|nr:MAG: hypothetical protein A3E87_10575 [Gammaproteobacteria bacterium RIFCSPHIGHO2_12_FULL_35_23]
MLKQRIITGSLLAILALIILFFLPVAYFMVITALIVLLGAWEWSFLAGLIEFRTRIIYLILMLGAMIGSFFLPVLLVLIIASLWWLIAGYLVVKYPATKVYLTRRWVRMIMGFLVLVPCWLTLSILKASNQGIGLLLFLLCLVWAADIGAYFAGKWWGKDKLIPNVSPGKTWQGLFGGLIFSFFVAVLGLIFLKIDFTNWFLIFCAVILLNIFAVIGDLFESMLKRYCQLKDSGNILPGHGGILDRIDSLTAAAPIFLLGIMLHLL